MHESRFRKIGIIINHSTLNNVHNKKTTGIDRKVKAL